MNQTTCCGCGQTGDNHSIYGFCPRCDSERNDSTVKPLVKEYIGGVLGSMPGWRNVKYAIQRYGFQLMEHIPTPSFEIPFYVRPDDPKSPVGLIAICTQDDRLVIFGDMLELKSLLSFPGFISQPIAANLPLFLESKFPHKYDLVRRARGEG